MNPTNGKRILLGVTGSIAAYKAVELASRLTQAGALIDVILTEAAQQFVSALTFQSVTGRKAYQDSDLWGAQGHVLHIGLAKQADLMLIAPASANTLAKLAYGLADNLLTVTALAATCRLLVAPAMDGGMFEHPATQTSLKILTERNVGVLGPAEGHLASGMSGKGRLVDPADLLGAVRFELSRGGRLAGKKVIVTAGGTQEPIDPVRVISNRSSGKQGFALAQAALDLGAAVTLISGPVALETPFGAQRVDVESTQQMLDAVLQALPGTDILLMAAAVADFRPTVSASEKLKKEQDAPQIILEHTPDILKKVAAVKERQGWPRLTVGFAAESQNLLENARQKLRAKKLDLIAANDISSRDAGFSVDNNRITLLFPDGRIEALPLMTKLEAAGWILQHAAEMLEGKDLRE